MTFLDSIVLGIVQGLAEFLPISSSGHLVILQQWLAVDDPSITFNVALHLGSLVAVVTVLWNEWWLIGRALLGRAGEDNAFGRRLFFNLVLASLPVAVVGFLMRDTIDAAFSSAYVPGIMLLITGCILWYADRHQSKGSFEELSGKHALWMGVGQAIALLPGLSRSGTTLAAGMLTGIDRQAAARFSFMMAVPAIFGAALLEIISLISGSTSGTELSMPIIAAGTVASAVTSFFAIRFFLAYLRRGRLIWFARYVWVIGAVVLGITALGS